jgi:hypothetical protein
MLAETYGDDAPTDILLRAATAPAMIGTTNWASQLAVQSVADFVVGLAPVSAGAELIRRGLRVTLYGAGSVQIPRRLVVAADAGGFVGEGEPLQTRQLDVTAGLSLSPFKFGTIVTWTRQLAEAAIQDFESIIRQILTEAAGLALDAALFSATAASSIRPAGLLAGLTTLSPTTGGGANAFAGDIGALVGALTTGGGRNVVFVAGPAVAAAAKCLAGPKFDFAILSSAGVAADTLIALDVDSLVSGFDPIPDFNVSQLNCVVHHEDLTPLPIGSVGSPSTAAAPVRSFFQTDTMGLRMFLKLSYGFRAPASVAFITGVTWA